MQISEATYDKIRAGIRKKIAERAAQPKRMSRWIPHAPTERQGLFLSLEATREAFYGGAAGGGKSDALLMEALKYADTPGYSALLLRKTYAELSKPGALMDRAHQWLSGTGARWKGDDKQWRFPSGAVLSFGYLESANDRFQYQSAEYQFIGIDELTEFESEATYTWLFSRLRRLKGVDIPIRMRAGSNPGGLGARWVFHRFIPESFTPVDAEEAIVRWVESEDSRGKTTRRAFVPARVEDNPYLDQAEYVESLDETDDVTREQLLKGDWRITDRGDIYPMWNEPHHVIPWWAFNALYQSNGIPKHWPLGIFMDNGTTEGHPNVTSWFATAPENAPLSGSVFLYRGHCVYDETTRNISEHIKRVSAKEMDRIAMWRNGHEGNSERLTYNRDFQLPFSTWKADPNRGIAQVRNYLEIQHKKQPHPFNWREDNPIMGRPMLYVVVADDQLDFARDDDGMARWREEFAAYHYKRPKSGEVATIVAPHPLFNDAMDSVRAAGAEYFAPIVPLSREERVTQKLEKVYHGRTWEDILALPPEVRDGAIHRYREQEQQLMKQEKSAVVVSGIARFKKRRAGTW